MSSRVAAAALLGLAAALCAGIWFATGLDATGKHSPSAGRVVVVQNKVAFGPSNLVEDDSPSYLAARPVAHCANHVGCKLPGTDMASGDVVNAVCQLQGDVLTNADVRSAGIGSNPNIAASALWYGVDWSDGRRGYLSEVYVAPTYRGGLGLPAC